MRLRTLVGGTALLAVGVAGGRMSAEHQLEQQQGYTTQLHHTKRIMRTQGVSQTMSWPDGFTMAQMLPPVIVYVHVDEEIGHIESYRVWFAWNGEFAWLAAAEKIQ